MSATSATKAQKAQPGVAAGLATVSGSTSACRYNVVINNDGSAKATISGIEFHAVELQQFPPGTVDAERLLSLLAGAGDVSSIPTETVQIAYGGKISGNLQSIPEQASGCDPARLQACQDLAKFVHVMLGQLKIS